MAKRYPIHKIFDLTTGELFKTYYTLNPIPENTTFEIQFEGRTLIFRLDQHFVSNEKISLVEFLGEKT